MPAFDPVRDAVLNSPLIPSEPSLPPRMHLELPRSTFGSSSSADASATPSSAHSFARPDSSPASGTIATPGITRRATDLSVLLNSDPQDTPLFTPTTPRAPATLSHLLLPTEASEDQLSNISPLRRRSSDLSATGSTTSNRESSYFSWPGRSSSATLSDSPQAQTSLALPTSQSAPHAQSESQTLMQTADSPASVTRSPVAPMLSNIITPNVLGIQPPASRPSSSHSHSSRPSTAVSSSAASRSGGMGSRAQDMPPPAAIPAPAPASTPSAATPSPGSAPRPAPAGVTSRQTATPPATSALQPHPSLTPKHPPSTSPQMASTSSNADVPKRSSIPYAPVRRRTPAGSVLVPLSPAEMERYRNFPGGVGTMLLRKRKREAESENNKKRERSEESENSGEPEDAPDERDAKKRRVGDVGLIVEHCEFLSILVPWALRGRGHLLSASGDVFHNARPDVGVTQRQESSIIGLKSFNNWVKSVLITRFAHPVLAQSPISSGESDSGSSRGRGGGSRGRVLDMGCGKGGDLTKWSKAHVREYVGVDIAAISVDQARLRHASMRSGPRFAASFYALDCYSHKLRDALPSALLERPFDVVSMQFCMHYAFESETKTRCMLDNVARSLRPGGIFIGTVPNAGQLLDRLDGLPRNAETLSFGNSVYKIRFEERTHRAPFGHRYWFFLQDAVDDVPEYVVQWDNFVEMAEEYGLHPVYKNEFHQIFEEHHTHHEFGQLLERMRVVDANGESQMDEDQWEAANIYVGFAFEKR
ncbi:uncharacterized protein FIBRA_08275 [Fibroporia radiculosa]|uniref:mRNA cap guanine-N(7) methyltransferase n=1 Tax=Fibroporia radiculosa TaxID=599839 RepID=J4GWH8_9APHY|nr:uncharacterized protein FIBRA_08275 [Fibroporia radiculosa]CCM06030.1 predicted protein [Fibroporia radiculosa]